MNPIDLEAVGRLAVRARIEADTRAALAGLAAAVNVSGALRADTHAALEALRTRPAAEAVAQVAALAAERALGRCAPVWHLLLALLEIPEADARHARAGIPPEVSDDTWGDLGLWASHFGRGCGLVGITLEILGWAQHYLRGGVVRVGMVQWELRAFGQPVEVFRERATGELRLAATPGAWFSHGGLRQATAGEPGALQVGGGDGADAFRGHPIDPRRGAVDLTRETTLPRSGFEHIVGPDTRLLELHVPADATLDLREIVASARRAAVLLRGTGDAAPRGLFGVAWLLDPQVRALVPDPAGVTALQRVCALFPGAIPEDKTVRRLFGPDAARPGVVAAPREGMNRLQRAVAQFLRDPTHVLCAAGGILPDVELDALERATQGG